MEKFLNDYGLVWVGTTEDEAAAPGAPAPAVGAAVSAPTVATAATSTVSDASGDTSCPGSAPGHPQTPWVTL